MVGAYIRRRGPALRLRVVVLIRFHGPVVGGRLPLVAHILIVLPGHLDLRLGRHPGEERGRASPPGSEAHGSPGPEALHLQQWAQIDALPAL